MSKNSNQQTNTTRAKRCHWGFWKFFGIFLLLTAIAFPWISYAYVGREDVPDDDAMLTVLSFSVEDNIVVLDTPDGEMDVFLLGINLVDVASLDESAKPTASLDDYVGLKVYLKFDENLSETNENDIPQAYIMVADTKHVMQFDLMVDDLATMSDSLSREASRYQQYWECSVLGIYPDD